MNHYHLSWNVMLSHIAIAAVLNQASGLVAFLSKTLHGSELK